MNILQAAGLKADPYVSSLLAKVPGPQFINNYRTGDSTPGPTAEYRRILFQPTEQRESQ